MRYKVISYDGKFSIEVKKEYTEETITSKEDPAVINLCARDKVNLTDLRIAILDCLDGTLGFKINPGYQKIIVYFHKAQSSYGRKFIVDNDADYVIFDLEDQITL